MESELTSCFTATYPILGGGFFLAGRASGEVKRGIGALRLPPELLRRVVIATYEAEMNIVIHAVSGELSVCTQDAQVTVIAVDRGPGIADIEEAMAPGYSTASDKARSLGFGAGMGLANMRRCADEFAISSEVNRGTRVEMIFRPRPSGPEED